MGENLQKSQLPKKMTSLYTYVTRVYVTTSTLRYNAFIDRFKDTVNKNTLSLTYFRMQRPQFYLRRYGKSK